MSCGDPENYSIHQLLERIEILEGRVRYLETISHSHNVWEQTPPELRKYPGDWTPYFVDNRTQIVQSSPIIRDGSVLVADSEGGFHWQPYESVAPGPTINEPVWNPE